MKCPIHDSHETSLVELLKQVRDPERLAAFALDVAGHAADQTSDPTQAKEWLDAARAGDDPEPLIVAAGDACERAFVTFNKAKEAEDEATEEALQAFWTWEAVENGQFKDTGVEEDEKYAAEDRVSALEEKTRQAARHRYSASAVLEAIDCASAGQTEDKVACASRVIGAAAASAEKPEVETSWQFQHARNLFCNCPRMPDKAPTDDRSRRSILAS